MTTNELSIVDVFAYREPVAPARMLRTWLTRAPSLRRIYYRTRINVTSADANGPGGERLLLTIDEAADMLRISRWKLYDYIHNRQLKTVKFGARRLVPAAALQALIEQLSDEEAL